MFTVSINHELDRLKKDLNDLQKRQLPFATAKALTATAKKIKEAEVEEMKKVFDRPTRFTLNSLFVDPAKKANLKARVWLRDWAPKGTPATKYLAPQIEGGHRKLKGFERLLKARGILPDGYYAVPAKKAKRDRYGNLSKGLLNQILSYSGAQRDQHQNTKQGRKRQTKAKFIVYPERDGKPGGIWALTSDQRTYPVLIFVKDTSYAKKWDFHGVARRTFDANISKELDLALAYALTTAKKSR